MANILDEQERKRKELEAQGIRTKGVAGAQGGQAEIGYVPPSRRNAPINQIPPQNASPQADYARSAEGGAMIPSDKVGQARMLGAMPNQGSLTPFEQPTDTWIQRSRDFTQSRVGGTNQQLQMQRQEMGANNTSLTQMASRIDPSIKQDAERARAWRTMTPQQRREEVDRLAIEQDVRTASQMSQMTEDDIQKYGRTLADASGTFIDSYGRASPMYSPETQIRIRKAQREIESEWAGALSSYDKTKWQSPQDMYEAIAALPSVQRAGEFGKAIAFNIVRKYSTPQMKAQMEAEDRNQKLFRQTFTAKAAEEIVQRMAQADQVSPEYAGGYKFTNEGSREFADQIWLNKDKDPRAGQIVSEIMANAPIMWTEENGRVVQDPAHQERRRVMLEQHRQQATEQAARQERESAIRAEQIKYSGIKDINPERASMMKWNEATGTYDDLSEYAPEKQDTDWSAIYQNNAAIDATRAGLEWSGLNEQQAIEKINSEFPIPALRQNEDPNGADYLARKKQAEDNQALAYSKWKAEFSRPGVRERLERELYNLELRGQELRKGFQNPPKANGQPAADAQSTENITLNSPPTIAAPPSSPAPQVSRPSSRGAQGTGEISQNRRNYERAGTFRVGKLPDESIYEQYKVTGRISVAAGDIDKIPISVSVAGQNEYITMVDPNELSSFMKKSAVGPASAVKVRVVPIEDISEVSVGDKDVESIRNRFGISPYANKKQVLAVAADRINNENKKRVHPFKNMFDWSPDLQWFQA